MKYMIKISLFILLMMLPLALLASAPAPDLSGDEIGEAIEEWFEKRFPIPTSDGDAFVKAQLDGFKAEPGNGITVEEATEMNALVDAVKATVTPSVVLDTIGNTALGADRHEKMKWYNTVVTPDHWKAGIYKGDILEAARAGGDMVVDTLVRKFLAARRIESVYAIVKEDYKEFLEILEGTDGNISLWDRSFQSAAARGFGAAAGFAMANSRTRQAQLNPLINYLKAKHSYFGVIPITKAMLLPLLGRWLWSRYSEKLEKEYAISLSNDNVRTPLATIAQACTYRENEEGKPVLSRLIFPLSPIRWISRIARIINDPFRMFRWEMPLRNRQGLRVAAAMNIIPSLSYTYKSSDGIEKKISATSLLLSDTAFKVYDFLGVCFGAKVFDELYNARWSQYVVNHRVELLSLLKAYARAVETGMHKKEAEQALKRFIEDGHRDKGKLPTTMLSAWWQAMKAGQSTLPSWVGLAITGGIALRGVLAFVGI